KMSTMRRINYARFSILLTMRHKTKIICLMIAPRKFVMIRVKSKVVDLEYLSRRLFYALSMKLIVLSRK
ncbi:MAG TPA: hypothetical protein PLJ57_08405, partial [Tepidanaerobacteraceae bacterium]|nr:hypothetical protein [Tepidanaerobacteraceae bacterium]